MSTFDDIELTLTSTCSVAAEKVSDRVVKMILEKDVFVDRLSKIVLTRMVHRDVSIFAFIFPH